jgi:small subunit ribosomal protein S8
VYLKYDNKKPVVRGLKRISRPGLRVYIAGTKVPKVLNGLGTAVISTSKGVITDHEARKIRTGGEVLCHIW